jgi:thioesterase domain-containing protein
MTMPKEPPQAIARDSLRLRPPYAAPALGLESQVAGVFAQVLGVTPVGADDDFYDLGGDSLLGEQISMELLQVTGRVFPISGLFEAGTPRAIAAVLAGTAPAAGAPGRETFFIVHGRGGYSVPRPEFMAGLTSGARVVMFELPGIRGDAPHPRTIRDVARAYVDRIETDLPQGPVRLAAFCTGGLIALDMARLLADRGRAPAALVLLDPGTLKPHRLRHRAETALARNPASLSARLGLLRAVGRLSPDAAGFEPVMMRLRVLRAWGSLLLGQMTRAKTATRYRGAGLRIGPRAWLNAAYRHAWPAPVPLQVQIIASKARENDYLRADGPWAYWLPDRVAHVMVDTHEDILSGTSAPVATAMEALLLGRDLPPGIATTRRPAPARSAPGPLGAAATAAP